VFQNAEVRRNITKLQLLDAITGQGDRHMNNFFIDDATSKVTGIDNDQCFGKDLVDPNEIGTSRNYLGKTLPKVVDKKMVTDIDRLTDQKLDEILSDMLTPEEISATTKRLQAVKEHLKGKSVTVIERKQWDNPIVATKNTTHSAYFQDVKDVPAPIRFKFRLLDMDQATTFMKREKLR
jgi:hypothetical protein